MSFGYVWLLGEPCLVGVGGLMFVRVGLFEYVGVWNVRLGCWVNVEVGAGLFVKPTSSCEHVCHPRGEVTAKVHSKTCKTEKAKQIAKSVDRKIYIEQKPLNGGLSKSFYKT